MLQYMVECILHARKRYIASNECLWPAGRKVDALSLPLAGLQLLLVGAAPGRGGAVALPGRAGLGWAGLDRA